MMSTPNLFPFYQAIDQAGSAESLRQAVIRLSDLRAEESILKLIEALGYNNPGAAVAAVEGLIAIGRPAVEPLLGNIDGFDYGARAWANRALAGIGDPRVLDNLCDASLSDFALSVRRAATKGLGNIHWDWLAAAERPAAQTRALQTLQQAIADEEWVVRYAAVVGLEGLGIQVAVHRDTVTDCLMTLGNTEPEQVVQLRIRQALARL
ncbi:MAG: HEAT repeat domain-containing protein [Cyanobacteria bacterium P01_G01_bin.54]